MSWQDTHPAEAEFLADYKEGVLQGERSYNEFYGSLCGQLIRKGELSEKQTAALTKAVAKQGEWDALRAEEAANATPVIEGKIRITGEVVSTDTKFNQWGARDVMTVKDDRGFKVWGSVPRAVSAQKGARVTFSATVEKSDRDETFGFFKRPTNAELLEAA